MVRGCMISSRAYHIESLSFWISELTLKSIQNVSCFGVVGIKGRECAKVMGLSASDLGLSGLRFEP